MFRRADEPIGLASRLTSSAPRSSSPDRGATPPPRHHRLGDRARRVDVAPVTRIEVDLGLDFTVGLHRAPSLAVAHRADGATKHASFRAPDSARFRAQAFRGWLGPDVKTAIAYAWPGIDNSWIKPFLQIAKSAGIATVVAIASLPRTTLVRPASLADTVARADLSLVGDEADAVGLSRALG